MIREPVVILAACGLLLGGSALAQNSSGSGVRPWTEADTAASRASRAANPAPTPEPMPARPNGYEGLSDRDLYMRLSSRVTGTPAQAMAALAAMTAQEKAWMKAYAKRAVNRYVADRDAGRLPVQQAATVAPPHVAKPVAASLLTNYEQGVVAQALHYLRNPRTVASPFADNCGSLRNLYSRMPARNQVDTDRYCPSVQEMNRARTAAYEKARAEAAREYAAEGARAAASGPLPIAGAPLTKVRTYDQRTGTYTGTEVMSQTEAELRGVRPR